MNRCLLNSKKGSERMEEDTCQFDQDDELQEWQRGFFGYCSAMMAIKYKKAKEKFNDKNDDEIPEWRRSYFNYWEKK